jgi:hypothetical protein
MIPSETSISTFPCQSLAFTFHPDFATKDEPGAKAHHVNMLIP